MATTNPHEHRNRAAKREALLAQLDTIVRMCGLNPEHDSHLVVGVVRDWSPSRWAELAVSCGKAPPSEKTREMVLEALVARGRAA